MKRILIIEDENAIAEMIRYAISSLGYELSFADSIQAAKQEVHDGIPSLILLDWMLPDKSGIHFLKWLRNHQNFQHIPVIMLTAKAEDQNKIIGLESGADDYIIKPFSPLELKTRIKVILRRGSIIQPNAYIHRGAITIDTNLKEARVKDIPLALTPTEYKLLVHLITHPHQVHSREQLLTQIWGSNAYIDERTVDVQIKRLRQRLKAHGCEQYIKTHRGFGYLLSIDENHE